MKSLGETSPATLAVVGSVVIVLQAVVLAGVAVPAPHTGGDNAAYLMLGQALAEGAGYVERWDPQTPPHTKYPPGYPLVLTLLILAGASTWTAFKLSSAVALSAATLAAFAWVAQRRGALAAGTVALLLVLAGGWQDASRWILSEPWFLLWAFVSFWAAERWLANERRGARGPGEVESGSHPGWLVLAAGAALMAFGVRTAGLPVVLALLGALLLAPRFRAAGGVGGVAGVVVGVWLIRSARGGEGAYQSEFFLRNPYDPVLGTVGLVDLLGRVWTNLRLYTVEVLPTEWWAGAAGGGALVALGLVMAGLAVGGWVATLARGRRGPAELFVPLYGGMLLLWPEVWSGERFLLPLVPLILFYAGEAVWGLARWVAPRRGWRPELVGGGVLAVGVLALSLPALPATLDRADEAGTCRAVVDASDDVFACLGPAVGEFRAAAAWMGLNLAPDAVVLSRKPRILYALGGPTTRTFPFTEDPDRFLEVADAVGARYLLVDRWDAMADFYAVPVVASRPGSFCYLVGWGAPEPGAPGTDLLGILPVEDRAPAAAQAELTVCPDGWAAPEPEQPILEGRRVPRLVGR